LRQVFEKTRPVAAALIGLSCLAWGATGHAETGEQILLKVQQAAKQNDYEGVFTYLQAGRAQSSRIAHAHQAGQHWEKLNVLDGNPQTVYRDGKTVRIAFAEERKLVIEPVSKREHFPSIGLTDLPSLSAHYEVKAENKTERVAERDCQTVNIVPRDQSRYGYRLCIDQDTRLLLRSETLNAQGQAIEQVAFAMLRLGQTLGPDALKPPASLKDWKTQTVRYAPIKLEDEGWSLPSVLGFHRVDEVKRAVGAREQVLQALLSDGLASVSVFVEPYGEQHPTQDGSAARGAVHVVGKRKGDYWLTVLGEAPLSTVQAIADAITPISGHTSSLTR